MPDISKHEAVLDGLKKGTYHTLGVIVGGQKISIGEKIAKKGKKNATNPRHGRVLSYPS